MKKIFVRDRKTRRRKKKSSTSFSLSFILQKKSIKFSFEAINE